MLKVYGDSISGNCLKVKWVAEKLGAPYDWVETDVLAKATRTPDFLALNPAGQVPLVVLPDGRPLAQSNAIILHLAEMFEWLFWEQYSHEPYVAVARFQVRYLGKAVSELEPRVVERGRAALQRLEDALKETDYLAGGRLSLADVALVAYTRVAHEGGFDLDDYPAVKVWVGRVEAELNIA